VPDPRHDQLDRLCRLLRGETLKLRELEYVQAAQAFGVGRCASCAATSCPT
jgi:ABC-type dipeptide/oligopeptide/nickel transport system permease subunit